MTEQNDNPIQETKKHLADVARMEKRERRDDDQDPEHRSRPANEVPSLSMEIIHGQHPELKCSRCGRGPLTNRRQWVLVDKRKVSVKDGGKKDRKPDYRMRWARLIEPEWFSVCRRCWMEKFRQGVFSEEGRKKAAETRKRKAAETRKRNRPISPLPDLDTSDALAIAVESTLRVDPGIIFRARTGMGISQRDFAQSCGIHRTTLRRFETAKADGELIPVNGELLLKMMETLYQWPIAFLPEDKQDDAVIIQDILEAFCVWKLYPYLHVVDRPRYPKGEELEQEVKRFESPQSTELHGDL